MTGREARASGRGFPGEEKQAWRRQGSVPRRWQASEAAIKLAHFANRIGLSDLSDKVIKHTIRVVRDTIGVMLAGARLPEVSGLAEMGKVLSAPGHASLMGRRETWSPHFAALVNGAGAVSLELDEGSQYAINHPSVHIFPAALALAEEMGKSGADLIEAFVAGYEVAVRVGKATHLRDPVHPFGTHAIIGAAATAARLMGLDEEHMAQALDLAAGICIASSQTAANAGASVRNLVTGMTNHNGLLAPMLIRAGHTGEPGALNVVFGRILGDSFAEDHLGDDLGEEFYITRNYFKLYACSRWNHAPIQAMSSLMERSFFEPQEVEKITVWTYDPATRLSWNKPVNGYAAKHSIPFNVAARVVRKSNDLDVYSDEAVSDALIRDMASRIEVREDRALTAMLPHVRPARVQVTLRSGKVLEERIDRPQGGFDNPYPEEELLRKFRRLALTVIPGDAVEELESRIVALPGLANVRDLSPLLQGGNSGRAKSTR
jgi:2-methylcitrate dehydratase PrpD